MTADEIADLLRQEMDLTLSTELCSKLVRYLELLVRWNARTNLTAVRDEKQIVLRHFGESLQCAQALPPESADLLDYGSGAGFPGLICSLAKPGMEVLLAESQGKKAAFLQEACRSIPARAKVYAGRVEALSAKRLFDVVTMRAVDGMESAVVEASRRVRSGGRLMVMTTRAGMDELAAQFPQLSWQESVPILGTDRSVIALGHVCWK